MPRDCSRSSVAGVDLEAGKAKERRARYRGRDAVQRHFDRRDAVVDFLDGVWPGGIRIRLRWRPGVMSDGVALGRDPAHQFRMFRGRLADQEERRPHAFARPAPPAPSASSAAMGRHRRSAPPRDRRAAASAETSSARPAAWWRHRREECARCRAFPCAGTPPPGPPRVHASEATRAAASTFDRTSGPDFAGAYLSLRLVLPIG